MDGVVGRRDESRRWLSAGRGWGEAMGAAIAGMAAATMDVFYRLRGCGEARDTDGEIVGFI